MFTQPIKATQMFEHGDSLDKQKGACFLCLYQQILRQNEIWFLS